MAGLVLGIPETRRTEAAALFRARGVPHRRVEQWKYSDLKAALGDAGVGAGTAQWRTDALPGGVELFDLAQGNPPDWVRENFAHATDNVMSAASLTLATGGVALRVPKGVTDPLTLEFSGAGHVRALLVLEAGASLTLIEGVGVARFRNVGLEIVLGEGAALDHIRVSPADADAVLVEEADVRLAARAQYRAHFASFGSKLSRMEVEIFLGGAGAAAHLSGFSVLDGKRHSDVTTHVTHAHGDTVSTQLFRHVAGGTSRAVYQGKVTVAQGANGSDSNQSAKALLLGESAEANLKPELEIFADDVKCAHGAAVGDLDADSLFYLRARGIPESEARGLLLHAFLEDAVAEISDTDQRERVRTELLAALKGIG